MGSLSRSLPATRTGSWPGALAVLSLLLGSPLSVAAGSDPVTAPATATAALAAVMEDYWQEELRFNPSLALERGEYRFQDQFDDSLEDEWRADRLASVRRLSRAVAAISPQTLGLEDRTSREMLRYYLAEDEAFYAGSAFETARMLPIDHFQGPHLAFAHDAAGEGAYPYRTAEDYDKGLVRAAHFARWADEAISRLREGERRRVLLPRIVVERLLPQLKVHLDVDPERSEFWKPVAGMPAAIPAADRERIKDAYRRSIADVIQPAYGRLYQFLRIDYLPRARPTAGLSAVPGGDALYRYYVRHHTTTLIDAAQIHALGRAEVKRIESEFARVQTRVGVPGSLKDLFTSVRSDPNLHFATPSDVIPAYQSAKARIVDQLPRLFETLPKAPFEIRALPESARESQGNGYYSPAAPDGTRPGVLWMNIWAPGVTDKFTVMTISLHEGLPGHHLQTSIAAENDRLPAFRRYDSTNAYVEGWGLYAESLGNELQVFDDPWQYYGHLTYALLRANRLVIDTGIHALGWSAEKGIDWMLAHSSMTREQAAAEVERYVAYPGQALSYKVGELKIRSLRIRAETVLRNRFDVRAFHRQILMGGSMPLAILTARIEAWISVTLASPLDAPTSKPRLARDTRVPSPGGSALAANGQQLLHEGAVAAFPIDEMNL